MMLSLKVEKKKVGKKKYLTMSRKPGYYFIGELVYKLKITARTIRLYEGLGLLNPLREGAHRYYDQTQYDRLLIILKAQCLGLSLQDIAKIFATNGDFTLSDIVNLLSPRQLLSQREELVRQMQHMDAVLSEIDLALREPEQAVEAQKADKAGRDEERTSSRCAGAGACRRRTGCSSTPEMCPLWSIG